MPFESLKNQSEKFRNKWGDIYEAIKRKNPGWPKDKVAKITWSTVKKSHGKSPKTGTWVKN